MEVSIKAELAHWIQKPNTTSHNTAAVLLSTGSDFQGYCSRGHTPISDVTAGILPIIADGKHPLWHHWLKPEVQLDVRHVQQQFSVMCDSMKLSPFTSECLMVVALTSQVQLMTWCYFCTVNLQSEYSLFLSGTTDGINLTPPVSAFKIIHQESSHWGLEIWLSESLLPSCLAWSGLLCCPPLTAIILKLYSLEGSKSSISSFASCFDTWTSFCSPPVPG